MMPESSQICVVLFYENSTQLWKQQHKHATGRLNVTSTSSCLQVNQMVGFLHRLWTSAWEFVRSKRQMGSNKAAFFHSLVATTCNCLQCPTPVTPCCCPNPKSQHAQNIQEIVPLLTRHFMCQHKSGNNKPCSYSMSVKRSVSNQTHFIGQFSSTKLPKDYCKYWWYIFKDFSKSEHLFINQTCSEQFQTQDTST